MDLGGKHASRLRDHRCGKGALSYPMNMSRYDWGYWSEPEPHLGGRQLACPRGKVIGGSSSINGMVYVRGHARDFDTWSEMGAHGWSYADVLPYYLRQESWTSAGHGGDPEWRGKNGPLHVTRGKRENPLVTAFVEAGVQAGYEATADYNGQKQEGFGPMEQTTHNGERWSAAKAYLRPAIKTGRVQLIKGLAEKIEITEGRAHGVRARIKGASQVISANVEVIIAASAINSPKLLMLSGIGDADHLQAHGIPVVADRKGVGQNLQDHLELYIQMAASQPVSLYKYWNLFGKAWVAHVGPMRSPSRGSVTLRSSDPALDAFIKDHVESAYHPCGTCKMGDANDPMAVVDPECRVIGVSGLRVADSSIFPRITNGNLNGPSIMVGEKASDHILGRTPLPASNQEPWIHPNWESQQR